MDGTRGISVGRRQVYMRGSDGTPLLLYIWVWLMSFSFAYMISQLVFPTRERSAFLKSGFDPCALLL